MRTNRHIIWGILLLLGTGMAGMAQEGLENRSHSHELNIGIAQPFTAGTNITINPGYRFYTINGAYRFSVAIGSSKEEVFNISENYWGNSLILGFYPGYERILEIERFDFYYGSDLLFYMIRNASDIASSPEDLEPEATTSLNIGLRPFVGLRFRVSSSVSVAMESHIYMIYSLLDSELAGDPDAYSYGFGIYSVPMGWLSLSYRF